VGQVFGRIARLDRTDVALGEPGPLVDRAEPPAAYTRFQPARRGASLPFGFVAAPQSLVVRGLGFATCAQSGGEVVLTAASVLGGGHARAKAFLVPELSKLTCWRRAMSRLSQGCGDHLKVLPSGNVLGIRH
jgi:hypothetical protein